MVYYSDDKIRIRNMEDSDTQEFSREEELQGWGVTAQKFEMRLRHQGEGKCIALTAEYRGKAAGYVSVYPNSEWGAFGNQGLPEIVDFAVLEKFRGHGIGTKLMDAAEEVAASYADRVYLGVGLHSGYGSAQRMYAKRGYIPDGSGVWYGDHVCSPYSDCRNDDNLNLYLIKSLKKTAVREGGMEKQNG